MISNEEPPRSRFDLIDQEQLAAQIVAVMDACFHRPTAEEKLSLLRKAERQIEARELLRASQQACPTISPTP